MSRIIVDPDKYKDWIKDSAERSQRKFAKQVLFHSNYGGQIAHATPAQIAACNREMEESFWKAFTANKAEVILTKQAVMMIETMHGGIPKGWGEPMKKKGLWAWLAIHTPKSSKEFLDRPLFGLLPAGSFYVSWTSNAGTARDWIGDPVKFGMDVKAPIAENHPDFIIMDKIDRGDWDL